jgi:Htaa
VRHARLTHEATRGRGIGAVALALAGAITLALTPGASAKVEPVGGGKTTLKIKKAMTQFLADTGTRVKAIDPAKDKKSGFQFPIKNGELDNKKAKGKLKHDGGVELRGEGGRVELTKLAATFGKSSKLKAKVENTARAENEAHAAKKNTRLFDLDTDNAKVKQKGEETKVTGIKATLTSKGAAMIEKVADMELDDRDAVFGKLKVAAQKGDLVLDGGNANLALAGSATQTLNDQGISSSPIDPATREASTLNFPITGGKVGADGGSGTTRLDGGLRLAKGGTNLDINKPHIDLARGEVSAVIAGNRGTLLSFDPGKAKVTAKPEKVTITGIDGALTADGAIAINEAFGTTAFQEDARFGTFEVKGTVKSGGGS